MKKGAIKFKQDRDSTEDDSLLGHPKTSTTDEQVDAIHCLDLDDRSLTTQQIAKFIGISSGLAHSVLTEVMGMSKTQNGFQEC